MSNLLEKRDQMSNLDNFVYFGDNFNDTQTLIHTRILKGFRFGNGNICRCPHRQLLLCVDYLGIRRRDQKGKERIGSR